MLKRYFIQYISPVEAPEGDWVRAEDVKTLEEAAQAALEDLSDLLFGHYVSLKGYETIEQLRAALGEKNNLNSQGRGKGSTTELSPYSHNDRVKCNSCGVEQVVLKGAEQCLACKAEGCLAWVDPDNPEVPEEPGICELPTSKGV